ncbi:uncharacterized protein SCHCODRAFT_02548545 [Schizophyllum commune H4-8]|nr:uncharacterized protein SCHCODRAFT_02548545 [Schizophyllum commune H4-8]KAI5889045.1 hypothetical protein SCHCODRAFT_02548545 [Schizophyllum commune H4-8]
MSSRRAGRLERAGKAEQRGGEYMRDGEYEISPDLGFRRAAVQLLLAISERRASAHTTSRTRERHPTRALHTRRPQARLQAVGLQLTPSRDNNIFSSDFAFRRPLPSGWSCFQQSATTTADEFELRTRARTLPTPSLAPYDDDDLGFSSDSGFRRPPPTTTGTASSSTAWVIDGGYDSDSRARLQLSTALSTSGFDDLQLRAHPSPSPTSRSGSLR